MRRLAVLSLALVMMFALLIGSAVLMGRAQPPSERIERLHLTDCEPPCWNGITARVSSRNDVYDQMRATFPHLLFLPTSTLPFMTWEGDNLTTDDTSMNFAIDNGTVVTMGIRTNFAAKVMPSLGETLMLFGAPTCAVTSAEYLTLNYENAAHQQILQITVARLLLSSPIRSLTIGITKISACQKDSALSWHDFRASQYTSFSPS